MMPSSSDANGTSASCGSRKEEKECNGADVKVDNKNMNEQKGKQSPPAPKSIVCQGCQVLFVSRNSMFKHLRETNGVCLEKDHPKEFQDFQNYLRSRERIRCVLLVGYIPSSLKREQQEDDDEEENNDKNNDKTLVQNGDDVVDWLFRAMARVDNCQYDYLQKKTNSNNNNNNNNKQTKKGADANGSGGIYSRSYGSTSRDRSQFVKQDPNTSVRTELISTKLLPLNTQNTTLDNDAHHHQNNTPSVWAWIDQVNQVLENLLSQQKQKLPANSNNDTAQIRLLGRLTMPLKRFHAEVDLSHRRVEYILPIDFLYSQSIFRKNDDNSNINSNTNNDDDDGIKSRHEFQDWLPSFLGGSGSAQQHDMRYSGQPHIEPDPQALSFLFKMKQRMQSFTTQIIPLQKQSNLDAGDDGDSRMTAQNQDNTDANDKGAVASAEHLNTTTDKGDHQLVTSSTNNYIKLKKRRLSTRTIKNADNDKKDHDQNESKANANAKINTDIEHIGDGIISTCQDNEIIAHTQQNSTIQPANPPKAKNKTKNKSSMNKKKKGPPKTHVLQRRRFHNFTPKLMAHEFLAYRRLDRFFHRATIRIDGRCYIKLSLTGDLFLHGQVCRIIGLLIAIAKGVIDNEHDLLECIFDEAYPHLFPTPPAPPIGMMASEFNYMHWEGRVKLILTPRLTDRYQNGWNDPETLKRVDNWEKHIHQQIAKAWTKEGIEEDGRLVSERKWTETVLMPWAAKAQQQLQEYRDWKQHIQSSKALSKQLESLDSSVPALYETTLRLLREADASGLWPTTSPKRQLVMVSHDKEGKASTSLAVKHMKAKSNYFQQNNDGDSSSNNNNNNQNNNNNDSGSSNPSAYSFEEGQGGASGSFSVGAMPGVHCVQPKANTLFPELMKAAFLLEIALCPDREPSSTIAINRNAQFRPHTDSGAGAGQSTSLIVGLGNYTGGELVVEGEKKDIRYKAIEFNGWKQRHWTMPFLGERFSLVWFTPKGCEGVRGINLCQKDETTTA